MKSVFTFAVIAAATMSPAHAQIQRQNDRLDNGGFENPTIDGYQFFDESLPAWTVDQDEVEIINEAYGRNFEARSGSQFLALNGSGAVYRSADRSGLNLSVGLSPRQRAGRCWSHDADGERRLRERRLRNPS